MLLQQLLIKRKTKAVAKSDTSVLFFFFLRKRKSSWITFQEFLIIWTKRMQRNRSELMIILFSTTAESFLLTPCFPCLFHRSPISTADRIWPLQIEKLLSCWGWWRGRLKKEKLSPALKIRRQAFACFPNSIWCVLQTNERKKCFMQFLRCSSYPDASVFWQLHL